MAERKWYFYDAWARKELEFFGDSENIMAAVSEKKLPARRPGRCPYMHAELRNDKDMKIGTRFFPVIGDPRFLKEEVEYIGNTATEEHRHLFPDFIQKDALEEGLAWWALRCDDGKIIFAKWIFLGDAAKYRKRQKKD